MGLRHQSVLLCLFFRNFVRSFWAKDRFFQGQFHACKIPSYSSSTEIWLSKACKHPKERYTACSWIWCLVLRPWHITEVLTGRPQVSPGKNTAAAIVNRIADIAPGLIVSSVIFIATCNDQDSQVRHDIIAQRFTSLDLLPPNVHQKPINSRSQ